MTTTGNDVNWEQIDKREAAKLRRWMKTYRPGFNFGKSRRPVDRVHNCGGYKLWFDKDGKYIIIDGACYELNVCELTDWLVSDLNPLIERYQLPTTIWFQMGR